MKQAIIDIGSNSMRMTVYEIGENDFSPLFKEKVMVGLAGYVENGILSEEGIRCAYEKLAGFKRTLDLLGISDVKAFATASLRNVANSAEAAAAIKAAASLSVEVLSGEEEALYSYKGAMRELHICDGVFVDTGGASTEIVLFSDGKIKEMQSFGVGALNLYKKCVRKIIPGKESEKRIRKMISQEISKKTAFVPERRKMLVCVGGTARAALKLAKKRYHLSEDCRSIKVKQLEELCGYLRSADREALDLLLKLEPDRVHTIVPGMMILLHIAKLFQSKEIMVSHYGVREGYLCHKNWGEYEN